MADRVEEIRARWTATGPRPAHEILTHIFDYVPDRECDVRCDDGDCNESSVVIEAADDVEHLLRLLDRERDVVRLLLRDASCGGDVEITRGDYERESRRERPEIWRDE